MSCSGLSRKGCHPTTRSNCCRLIKLRVDGERVTFDEFKLTYEFLQAVTGAPLGLGFAGKKERIVLCHVNQNVPNVTGNIFTNNL